MAEVLVYGLAIALGAVLGPLLMNSRLSTRTLGLMAAFGVVFIVVSELAS